MGQTLQEAYEELIVNIKETTISIEQEDEITTKNIKKAVNQFVGKFLNIWTENKDFPSLFIDFFKNIPSLTKEDFEINMFIFKRVSPAMKEEIFNKLFDEYILDRQDDNKKQAFLSALANIDNTSKNRTKTNCLGQVIQILSTFSNGEDINEILELFAQHDQFNILENIISSFSNENMNENNLNIISFLINDNIENQINNITGILAKKFISNEMTLKDIKDLLTSTRQNTMINANEVNENLFKSFLNQFIDMTIKGGSNETNTSLITQKTQNILAIIKDTDYSMLSNKEKYHLLLDTLTDQFTRNDVGNFKTSRLNLMRMVNQLPISAQQYILLNIIQRENIDIVNDQDLTFSYKDFVKYKEKLTDELLTTRRWQETPKIINMQKSQNLVVETKNPIQGIGNPTNNELVFDEEKEGEPLQATNVKTKFYKGDDNHLFSLVTALQFTQDENQFPENVSLNDLISDENYNCHIQIATYAITKPGTSVSTMNFDDENAHIPEPITNDAVNIVRYDGGGYDHNNVFIKHNAYIIDDEGLIHDYNEFFPVDQTVKVPHLHFINNTQSIFYMHKLKQNYIENGNNVSVYKKIPAASNAINCETLANYLSILDNMTIEQLKDNKRHGGAMDMPFLDAKIDGIQLNIDLDKFINKIKKSMPKVLINESGEMDTPEQIYINEHNLEYRKEIVEIFNQINNIAGRDIEANNNGENDGGNNNGGGGQIDPTSTKQKNTMQSNVSFSSFIKSLKILQFLNDQLQQPICNETRKQILQFQTKLAQETIETLCHINHEKQGPEKSSQKTTKKPRYRKIPLKSIETTLKKEPYLKIIKNKEENIYKLFSNIDLLEKKLKTEISKQKDDVLIKDNDKAILNQVIAKSINDDIIMHI